MTVNTQQTYLNFTLVIKALGDKGITSKQWLYKKLGMSDTAGDLLLRRGLLPATPNEAERVLAELSKMTDLEISEIIFEVGQKSA